MAAKDLEGREREQAYLDEEKRYRASRALLILRPTVWCDKCRMALFYARIGDGEEFLQHPPTKDCVRSEQKFKRQTIELERIE